VLAFLSELNDETVLGTTNKKAEFTPPKQSVIQRRVGANAKELWALHQQRLSELNPNIPAKTIVGLDQVAAFEDKTLHRSYEDKVRRGIWVEMTEAEVAALRAKGIQK